VADAPAALFQSPDGDSVVSHREKNTETARQAISIAFQSPDGDSVVSHDEVYHGPSGGMYMFQSPDGDSVVSHAAFGSFWVRARIPCFSPLTGIPWFPTQPGHPG